MIMLSVRKCLICTVKIRKLIKPPNFTTIHKTIKANTSIVAKQTNKRMQVDPSRNRKTRRNEKKELTLKIITRMSNKVSKGNWNLNQYLLGLNRLRHENRDARTNHELSAQWTVLDEPWGISQVLSDLENTPGRRSDRSNHCCPRCSGAVVLELNPFKDSKCSDFYSYFDDIIKLCKLK